MHLEISIYNLISLYLLNVSNCKIKIHIFYTIFSKHKIKFEQIFLNLPNMSCAQYVDYKYFQHYNTGVFVALSRNIDDLMYYKVKYVFVMLLYFCELCLCSH